MYQPNKSDSIVVKYATIIEENKERRKYNGEYSDLEPEPLIYDNSTIGDTDDFGNPVQFNWDYTNLISLQCIMDIFGDDYNVVRKLLMVYPLASPVMVSDGEYEWEYYREVDICRVIDILTTLAKTNFVNVLRPQYQFIKDDEPVYTSEDLKNLLGIKDELFTWVQCRNFLWLLLSRFLTCWHRATGLMVKDNIFPSNRSDERAISCALYADVLQLSL